MNTTQSPLYLQAANMIYTKTWTDRFLTYLLYTHNKCAMTFIRKYQDDVMRHEDVTEFIVGDLAKLVEAAPTMFSSAVWEDETIAYSQERGYIYTCYLRFCIKRWLKYKKLIQHELNLTEEAWDTIMNTKAAPLSNNIESKLSNAITYRKLWLAYTDTLETIDKVVAMYLLDGCLSFEELKAATGLKKTALYARIEKIKKELAKISEEN